MSLSNRCPTWEISIHALREEGDPSVLASSPIMSLFLSTPSARRATVERNHKRFIKKDFYPRPPRGGRPT